MLGIELCLAVDAWREVGQSFYLASRWLRRFGKEDSYLRDAMPQQTIL